MKKIVLLTVLLTSIGLSACQKNEKTIVVGATPSPHAVILESKEVKNYIASKGYNLKVNVYQDYITPNKALDDEGLDANYFQHIPYLNEEVDNKGYKISAACEVHNEPLNLYSISKVDSFENKKIYIVNDASNVERAFRLLKANNIIDSYDVTSFDAQHPSYTSSIGATIECIDPPLLHKKVEEGFLAVIPGNYALTAWDASLASSYKLFGEASDVAYPNIIACRTVDLNSEKINVLVEALAQEAVKSFIEQTFGPTVNYCFNDLR